MFKELFLDLVKDGAFKSVMKKIMAKEDGGEGHEQVKPEDEDAVVDLTLRVAFGKMLSKISSGSAGKGASAERQKFVIRHLADSKVAHLELFLRLATECVGFLESDEKRIEQCWPIGKQLGTLQTLITIIKSVNWSQKTSLHEIKRTILGAIVTIGKHSSFLLTHKEKIRPGPLKQIKDVRTLAIQSLETFSEHSGYSFSESETGEILGWLSCLIVNLESESLDTPSPVMKLILTWTEVDNCKGRV